MGFDGLYSVSTLGFKLLAIDGSCKVVENYVLVEYILAYSRPTSTVLLAKHSKIIYP